MLQSLRLTAARPTTWVICGLLLASWPLWILAAPLGINSNSSSDYVVLYDLAIASFALGAVSGIGTVARLSESIRRISARPGLLAHGLAIGSVGFLHVLVAATPAILMGALGADAERRGFTVPLAVALLTIMSLGSLVLRLEVEAATTPWILGIGILLSTMLLPDPLPTRALLLLSGALLFAAWLLDHPPGRTTT
jgi:hypothetical protein